MEANTVILALPEYNALRDFKENIEKGNTYRTIDYSTHPHMSQAYIAIPRFVTTDEAVKEIAKQNANLSAELAKVSAENYALKNPETVEVTLNDVKRMSIWEFRRWKRNAR
jgi:hypothetical protein